MAKKLMKKVLQIFLIENTVYILQRDILQSSVENDEKNI